jgi:hypothetical protein
MLAMSMLLLQCLNKELLNIEQNIGNYLTIDIHLKYRIAMSTFRLSNHRLDIEVRVYIKMLLMKIVYVTFANSYN